MDDHLNLRLEDNDEEELNALTLTALLNGSSGAHEALLDVEEALSTLTPAQLIELERNVQKLKERQNSLAPGLENATAAAAFASSGFERLFDRNIRGSRKKGSRSSSGSSSSNNGNTTPNIDDSGLNSLDRPRPTGGQYMNLPASTPQIEYRDTIEWLIFTYSTKGHIQEYHIRSDIDDLNIEDIPEEFKAENCVYPRALAPREAYVGNRFDYEVSVNIIAWKLCWRNASVLCGKRGLIQRAVDSYRNRTSENRSRRVMRQEKINNSMPYSKRMHNEGQGMIRVPGPKTLTLQYSDRDGEISKIKIRVDVEGVDLTQVDDEFRASNAIYPQALLGGGPGYTTDRWDYELACNELGWKLAWLNSSKLAGKRILLQKSVEAYHSRMEAAERARQAVLQHQHHLLSMDEHGNPNLSGMQSIMYDPNQMLYGSSEGSHIQSGINSRSGSIAADIAEHLSNINSPLPGNNDPYVLDGSNSNTNDDFSQMVAHTLQQALAQGENGNGEAGSNRSSNRGSPDPYGGFGEDIYHQRVNKNEVENDDDDGYSD